MKRSLAAFVASILFPFIQCQATPSQDAAATVVVYNSNDSDSKNLADFYCAARGINPAMEIPLAAPLSEEISRTDYDISIGGPLREELIRRGYWMINRDIMNHPVIFATRIRYVAVIRGVPLKISQATDYPGDSKIQPDPFGACNAASVDSEISMLGYFTPQISGVLKNPVCNSNPHSNFEVQIPPAMLFVSRLDAPTSEQVKTMITDGLHAEKEGLQGWGYIDLRSITSGGYGEGDDWIRQAGASLRRKGIPVISDDLPDTFQSGFPVTDAAAYYGWYSENIDGPFADPFFRFVPGAVAVHLHSFSATTLHDPQKGWSGPLVAHGAAASVGNVYEPYLSFTTNLGVMAAALLAGNNLAQSYYMAQPVLSWMSVLVGDPLYRPYATLYDPAYQPPGTVWSDYRRIILKHQGNVLKSAADLTLRSRKTRESLYLEALGSAQMDAGLLGAAEVSFRDAGVMAKDQAVAFRLFLEQARAMEKQGAFLRGAALLRQGLLRFNEPPRQRLLLSWIQRMDPVKVESPTPIASPQPSTPPGA